MRLLTVFEMDEWVVFLILGVIIFIAYTISGRLADLRDQLSKKKVLDERNEGLLREKDLIIQNIQIEMKGKAQDMAIIQFEQWKIEELDKYKKILSAAGFETATAMLQEWKIENEDRIRKDAANRSVRNVLGKVTEHLIPFSDAMKQFNPKDIRFIGSPIDLIVFEGAEELKKDEITIHFIEVKTGTSALSKRQRLIREAVVSGRVKWLAVYMRSFGDEVNIALSE